MLFVKLILEIKDKFDKIINTSFKLVCIYISIFKLPIDKCVYYINQDKRIQKKLKESFEEFINKGFLLIYRYEYIHNYNYVDNRCASHLASYIDDLLKSGIQGISGTIINIYEPF